MENVRNLENLNLEFTSDDVDGDTVFPVNMTWHNKSHQDMEEMFSCDDSATLEEIKAWLTNESAYAEGLNVKIWFG